MPNQPQSLRVWQSTMVIIGGLIAFAACQSETNVESVASDGGLHSPVDRLVPINDVRIVDAQRDALRLDSALDEWIADMNSDEMRVVDVGIPESDSRPLPEYCSAPVQPNVRCNPDENLDIWHQTLGDRRFTISAGTILSIPFTTRHSTMDAAMLAYTTPMPNLNDYSWQSWVSILPAGDAISPVCRKSGNEARGNFYMTQKPAQAAECNLGTAEGVFYLNYRVYSPSNGYYEGDYPFDVDRTAY